MDVTLFGTTLTLDETAVSVSPDELRRQVADYESGERQAFEMDLHRPAGFTGAVMEAMAEIPYGETRTYGQLAASLDTAPVAVGQACGRNPLPLVVPCHRVVGADSLGGYSAGGDDGLALKRRLLDHERANR
ncbi:cysteine methyltransferase [Haloprofundus marisrubri]|uniref:Cysteine methyltransferase n=1 Tax=Haloprofundus marisrubri TaxID=1514971 RepID=A0A0W1R968_9EURY|nr:methylated-DNA--[protein]-cysteine S-methyltransferase [Haloprofundus marisrubri]KTG09992.1 cysteine methyltransferase [Haloprofundus marisrubri]